MEFGAETRIERDLDWASLEFLVPRIGILSETRRLVDLGTSETNFSGNMGFLLFLFTIIFLYTFREELVKPAFPLRRLPGLRFSCG